MHTVLLVDSPTVPDLAAELAPHVRLLRAATIEEALALLATHPVDALVCAPSLARPLGGLRLAQQARTRHPGLLTFAVEEHPLSPDRAGDLRRLFRLEDWVQNAEPVLQALGLRPAVANLATKRARLGGTRPEGGSKLAS